MPFRWFERAVLLVALLVPACQPVPQPFSSDDPARAHPLSRPVAQAGVLVRAVAGAPDAVGLAKAVAGALQSLEVAATTGAANRASRLLTARAETAPAADGALAVRIEWFVNGPSGEALGKHVQTVRVPARAWTRGDGTVNAGIAKAAAAALAPILGGAPAPAAPRLLVVHEVLGAPGDGNIALRRALVHALRQRGYAVADDVEAGAVVLSGTVDVTPRGGGGDDVAITWTALAPDGTTLGTVAQRNRVPAGSLSGAWGSAAVYAATAAVPGIADLLERTRTRSAAAPAAGPSDVASPPGG